MQALRCRPRVDPDRWREAHRTHPSPGARFDAASLTGAESFSPVSRMSASSCARTTPRRAGPCRKQQSAHRFLLRNELSAEPKNSTPLKPGALRTEDGKSAHRTSDTSSCPRKRQRLRYKMSLSNQRTLAPVDRRSAHTTGAGYQGSRRPQNKWTSHSLSLEASPFGGRIPRAIGTFGLPSPHRERERLPQAPLCVQEEPLLETADLHGADKNSAGDRAAQSAESPTILRQAVPLRTTGWPGFVTSQLRHRRDHGRPKCRCPRVRFNWSHNPEESIRMKFH